MGTGRDGVPVFLNADFLDGTRGAHVSISGISGVATKTSFATFLLYSVFRSGVLGGDAANAKALIFNVKGEDLLFLDHPNTRLDERHHARRTRSSACPPAPFPDVRVYAPPRAGDSSGTPDVSSRLTGRRRASTGRSPSSAPTGCCRTCSPTPTTSASSTRWSSTRSPPTWPGYAQPADGGVSIDGAPARLLRATWSTTSSSSSPTTRPAPPGRAARSAWARSTRSPAG